jgi:ribosomal protein S18 acetylase RimI-like enzyme
VTTAWLFYSEKGYISFLYVRPEFRRKGYAEKLIDSVLEKIPELKCHVEITNTSMLNLLRSKYEVISEEPAVSRTGKELIRFVWRKKNVEITK